MDFWPLLVVMASIPVLFGEISNRRGHARRVAVWTIMWCQAGLVAAATWGIYRSWHALLALPDVAYRQDYPSGLMGLLMALAGLLIVFPVAWCVRDARRERMAGA